MKVEKLRYRTKNIPEELPPKKKKLYQKMSSNIAQQVQKQHKPQKYISGDTNITEKK